MELFIVKLVAVFRPLASVSYAAPYFEVAGAGLFVVLLSALLVKGTVQQSLRLSAVDAAIFAFTVWCIAISLIYVHAVRPGELAKLLVPLLSYTIVKNVVSDRNECRKVLFWALVGLGLPMIASAALILAKSPAAVDTVNYWTQVTRWQGLYTHSHVLAHSATLTLMTLAIYALLRTRASPTRTPGRAIDMGFLGLVGLAALYGLYMSQVRTAILGLMIFLGVLFFFLNRGLLILGAAAATLIALATVPYWYAAMFPELVAAERGIEVKATDFGSGRPNFWLHDLRVYGELPLDQKLAGVGIGARGEYSVTGEVIVGHSDWLELLTQTGVVGFLLFAGLQWVILRKILRMEGPERYAFLAMFLAVNAMMLLSNSYAWRIQVSQLYYMMLAFIELPQRVEATRTPEAVVARAGTASMGAGMRYSGVRGAGRPWARRVS